MLMTEAEVLTEMEELLDGAEREDRNLNSDESRRWAQLESALDEFGERRAGGTAENRVGVDHWISEVRARGRRSRGTVAGGREHTDHQMEAAAVARRSDTWVDQDGREVRMLRAGDKLAESRSWPEVNGVKARDLDAGRALAGLVTNDWRGREAERRALDLTPFGGGVLVPDVLAAQFIDIARARIVTQLAGAVQFEMSGAEVTIAKLAGDFSPAWRAPNVAIAESTPTFGAVVLKARTLGAWFRVPREMVQDARNLPQLLVDSLSVAMANEIDRVALVGQAAKEEPIGLLNAGIGTTAGGGALTNYSKLLSAVIAILTANGPDPSQLAYILPPRTFGVLEGLLDTTNQPMRPPSSVAAMSRFVTTAAPINLGGGSNEAFVVVGDFSQMLQGIRMPMSVEVSNVGGGDTSTNVFTSHQTAVKITFRGDIGIVRPSFFNYLTGVTS